jgi:CRP-like cAMP-binding protein
MEIFGEGEPAEYLYEVVRGLVRRCKILGDGRRQITGFAQESRRLRVSRWAVVSAQAAF